MPLVLGGVCSGGGACLMSQGCLLRGVPTSGPGGPSTSPCLSALRVDVTCTQHRTAARSPF